MKSPHSPDAFPLLQAIGDAKDPWVREADPALPRKKRRRLLWAIPAAACAALLALTLLPRLLPGGDVLPLSRSQGEVTVQYTESAPAVSSGADLAQMTEEELLAPGTDILRGTVQSVRNIRITLEDWEVYRALAEIQVTDCLRGDIAPGTTVTVVLPCPLTEDIWVEDTDTVSRLAAGMEGIFLLYPCGPEDVLSYQNSTLYWSDVAQYRFLDGVRYAFLETEDDLVYAQFAYPSLEGAQSLDDIQRRLNTLLG